MQASVVWDHGMTFTGTADSGFEIPLGAHPSVGGENDGFRPLELMLVSLAGCTAMDVISILKKKRQDVTAFTVTVDADRGQAHPKVFTAAGLRTEAYPYYDPTTHGVDLLPAHRADSVLPGLSAEDALRAAPERLGDAFVVPESVT